MNNVISLKMLIAFFLIVFCIQDSAIAQQNEIESLQTKVENLQQKVSQLESKVERLEKLLLSENKSKGSKQPDNSSEGWRDIQNWRKLESGMSKEEVRQILGEPSRIDVTSQMELWDYPEGRVTIFNGELSGWSEPSN